MTPPPVSTVRPPVSLGLIGCGHWGLNLFREASGSAGASVTAACDIDSDRLHQLGKSHPGLSLFSSADELLKKSSADGVLIATPQATHYDLALAALQAGKHVYVEKLLGQTSTEAEELDLLARRKGLILMVGHVCAHDPLVEHLLDEVAAGTAGELLHIRAVRVALGRHQPDANVVWDLAPHDLSILQRLTGGMPNEVAVHGKAFVGDAVEIASIRLAYDAGPVVDLCVSWLDPLKERRWNLLGTKGSLLLDWLDHEDPFFFQDGRAEMVQNGHAPEFIYHNGRRQALGSSSSVDSPLSRLCRHFIDCLVTGSSPITGGPEGTALLTVLEACDRSIAAGGSAMRVGLDSPANVVNPAQVSW